MAPLYARYVPPKPAKPTILPAPVQKIPNSTEALDSQEGRKKRKRSDEETAERKARKAAKRQKEEVVEPSVDTEDQAEGLDEDEGQNTSSETHDGIKTKKTKKVRKIQKGDTDQNGETKMIDGGDVVGVAPSNAPDQEAGAEETTSRHKSVLSKFHKATALSKTIEATSDNHEAMEEPEEPRELHDLVPLPQPRRAPTPDYVPTFSALPSWLINPTIVPSDSIVPFDDLALSSKTVAHLKAKGFTSAFAVQAALLPKLLPHPYLTHLPPNDICVSAPTGSGKTLGYMLPIIESLRGRAEIKLRAVVVVPTRDLVTQAQNVAIMCAAGSGLQIATAIGSQNFASEQDALIRKGRRYDPEEYRRLMAKADEIVRCEYDSELKDQDEESEKIEKGTIMDTVRMLPDHVPAYMSNADILICTPGRLVEHLNNTLGFGLDDVTWLVIDEADRLLDQSFQEWSERINTALERTKDKESRHLQGFFRNEQRRYVRKVVLSATMTHDISKLNTLRLRRPSMIVVKTHGDVSMANAEQDGDITAGALDGREVYEIPPGLAEHAFSVGDGSEKPLLLAELLRSKILPVTQNGHESGAGGSDTSDTSSDSASDSSSSVSNTSSSEDGDSESSDSGASEASDHQMVDQAKTSKQETRPHPKAPMVLIFASSTEEASRLHHLLTGLDPAYKSMATLLTKSSGKTTSQLMAGSSKARVIISTDRASRGLDLPLLTHVVNYSMPRSLSAYIHRVGRTARAGRTGEAWTLFAKHEARWFWNEIAKASSVKRKDTVIREKVSLSDEWKADGGRRSEFEDVLEGMRDLVSDRRERDTKR